jgi:hypothetical protein
VPEIAVMVEAFIDAAPVQQVLGQPSKETKFSGFVLVTGSNQDPRLGISFFF